MKNEYKILGKQFFSKNEYSIIPIRFDDRIDIMNWRNDQIYHLRQSKALTIKDQDIYFKKIVSKLFTNDFPNQLLFSYLFKDKCIGYGGLVHINWNDMNAEISFLIDTNLDKTEFDLHWSIFLQLIEEVAFEELKIHKIFVYAFDVRPYLYEVLKKNKYIKDAVLKEHCFVHNNFKDVLIYSKWRKN